MRAKLHEDALAKLQAEQQLAVDKRIAETIELEQAAATQQLARIQEQMERQVEDAREAAEICSAIVRKDIGYRDIRVKRKEVDTLVKEIDA